MKKLISATLAASLALSLAALKDYTLGPERAARFAPAAAAQARGLPVLLHADPARLDPSPFAVMAAAIKRPLGEDQQLAPLDALKAVAIPAVEVHISAVETREDFRQVSYARLACFATITGEGLQGYAHALELLRERLEK